MHDEDLLGYLLGALEPHEMRRVQQWLRNDSAARRQLAEIERTLGQFDAQAEPPELPPTDLVSRTLDQLPPLPPPPGGQEPLDVDAGFGPSPTELPELGPTEGHLSLPGDVTSDAFDPQTASHSADALAASPASGHQPPAESGWTWFDLLASSAAATVLLGLLLPALAEGRFEARKNTCQDNMRQLGTELTQFVARNQQGRLPAVAERGPEAFAGVYALRLRDAGLLNDASIRWCPSLEPSAAMRATAGGAGQQPELVSLDTLHRASVNRLQALQRAAGGHYAYTLGVLEGQHFAPPRYESRASFAVMSDAPLGRVTAGGVASDRIGHSGRGINVLYEDGRVAFVALSDLDAMPDHPLLNHRGEVEAGGNVDDAALAPSWHPPFISVPQR